MTANFDNTENWIELEVAAEGSDSNVLCGCANQSGTCSHCISAQAILRQDDDLETPSECLLDTTTDRPAEPDTDFFLMTDLEPLALWNRLRDLQLVEDEKNDYEVGNLDKTPIIDHVGEKRMTRCAVPVTLRDSEHRLLCKDCVWDALSEEDQNTVTYLLEQDKIAEEARARKLELEALAKDNQDLINKWGRPDLRLLKEGRPEKPETDGYGLPIRTSRPVPTGQPDGFDEDGKPFYVWPNKPNVAGHESVSTADLASTLRENIAKASRTVGSYGTIGTPIPIVATRLPGKGTRKRARAYIREQMQSKPVDTEVCVPIDKALAHFVQCVASTGMDISGIRLDMNTIVPWDLLVAGLQTFFAMNAREYNDDFIDGIVQNVYNCCDRDDLFVLREMKQMDFLKSARKTTVAADHTLRTADAFLNNDAAIMANEVTRAAREASGFLEKMSTQVDSLTNLAGMTMEQIVTEAVGLPARLTTMLTDLLTPSLGDFSAWALTKVASAGVLLADMVQGVYKGHGIIATMAKYAVRILDLFGLPQLVARFLSFVTNFSSLKDYCDGEVKIPDYGGLPADDFRRTLNSGTRPSGPEMPLPSLGGHDTIFYKEGRVSFHVEGGNMHELAEEAEITRRLLDLGHIDQTIRESKHTGEDGKGSIFAIFSALVGTVVLGEIPNDKIMKRASDWTRTFNGMVPAIGKVQELLVWMLQCLPECIQGWVRAVCPESFWMNSVVKTGFTDWAVRTERLLVDDVKERVMYDAVLQDTVEKLWNESIKKIAEATTALEGAKGSKWFTYVMGLHKKLEEAYGAVLIARRNKSSRMTPYCIWLYGKPGIGKSLLMPRIAKLLAPEGLEEKSLFFSRIAANPNWDGYQNQFATGIDDFLQVITPESMAEFFSMQSSTPYQPPFASLTDPAIGKKGTQFTSEVTILSSNMAHPAIPGVSNLQAVWRRPDVLVEIVVPEVDGVPDKSAFRNDFTHATFRLLDKMVAHRILRTMNYREFMAHVYRGFLAHKDAYARLEAAKAGGDNLLSDIRAEVIRMQKQGKEPTLNPFEEETNPFADEPPYTDEQAKEAADQLMRFRAGKTKKHVHGSMHERLFKMQLTLWKRKVDAWMAEHPRFMFATKMSALALALAIPIGMLVRKAVKAKPERYNLEGADKALKALDKMLEDVQTGPMTPVKDLTRRHLDITRRAIANIANIKNFTNSDINDYMTSVISDYNRLDVDRKRLKIDKLEGVNRVYGDGDIADRKAQRNLRPRRTGMEGFWWSKDAPLAYIYCNELGFNFDVEKREVSPFPKSAWIKILDNQGVDVAFKMAMDALKVKAVAHPKELDWIDDAEEVNKVRTQIQALYEKIKTGRVERGWIEGSVDNNAMTIARDCVLPAMVSVTAHFHSLVTGLPKSQQLNGMGIAGSIVLLPYHLFCNEKGELIPERSILQVKTQTNVGPDYSFMFERKRLVRLVSSSGKRVRDACVYDFGSRLPPMTKRLNLFAREKELMNLKPTCGELVVLDPVPTIIGLTDLKPQKITRVYGESDTMRGEGDFTLTCGVEYKGNTRPGNCGGVIIGFDTSLEHKILALHVCGGPKGGSGELIPWEDLSAALTTLGVGARAEASVSGLPFMANLLTLDKAKILPEGNFSYCGVLPPNVVPRAAEKTQLVPSMLYDKVYPHLMEPAPLRPDDPRIEVQIRPLEVGTNKYGKPTKPMDPILLRTAVDDIVHLFRSMKTTRTGKKVLSEDEVINGITGEAYFEGLNMATSPGWPYTLDRPKREKGKEFLFEGVPGRRQVKCPKLRRALDERRRLAKMGMRVPSVWVGTLKDEKRLIPKVKLGKTRLFTCGPVDFTMEARRLTLSFAAMFYSNRLNFDSAVGIDPESPEWDEMFKKLLAVSSSGFAGDFGNYDGTLLPEEMEAVCEIVNRWYDDECSLERRVLFSEMTHTMQLCMNMVFFKHQGNPSGNPLTVIINTIVNMIRKRVGYLTLAPPEYRTLTLFYHNVLAMHYGDDDIVAVKREIQPWYNMDTMGRWLDSMGLEYTPPDKISARYSIVELSTQTFLKRGFRREGNFWVPTMDRITVQELVNWIRKSEDPYEACMENCATALRFAFFYGYNEYNIMRNSIMAVAEAERFRLDLPTYEFFNMFYGEKASLPFFVFNGEGRLEVDETDITYERQQKQSNVVAPNLQMDSEMASPMTVDTSGGLTQTSAAVPITNEVVTAVEAHPEAEMLMEDKTWTEANMAERPTLITTLPWLASQTPRTSLYRATVPGELMKLNVANGLAFRRYIYGRGRVRIRFHVKGNTFVQGKLLAGFVPLCKKGTVTVWHQENFSAATSIQHVVLDAAQSSVGEIVVPFVHPYNYLHLPTTIGTGFGEDTWQFLGTVYVSVLNQLRAAPDAVQQITVLVSVMFEDWEFKVPAVPLTLTPAEKATERVIREQMQGNTITTNYNMDKVANSTIGGSTTGDEIGRAAQATANVSALDKPSWKIEPPLLTVSDMGFFSNTTNITPVERLCAEPGPVKLVTAETFGTTDNEMDITWLTQKVTYSHTLNWAVGTAGGTRLDDGLICPLSDSLLNKWKVWSAAAITSYQPTCLDYVSARFSFWTGSLVYRIQVVASEHQEGQLFFGVYYGDYDVDGATLDMTTATQGYGVYLDLSEQNEWYIEIPYQAAVKTRVPSGSVPIEQRNRFAIGKWELYVVNQLSAPSNVYQSVDINVWIGGGHDYKVHGLFGNNTSLVPSSLNYGTIREQMQSNVILGAPTASNVDFLFDERTVDVQALLKRYERVGGKTLVKTWGTQTVSGEALLADAPFKQYARFARTSIWTYWGFDIGDLLLANPVQGGDTPVDLKPVAVDHFHFNGRRNGCIAWFGSMYRAWRGSVRFKIEQTTDIKANLRATVGFTPDSNYDQNNETAATLPERMASAVMDPHNDRFWSSNISNVLDNGDDAIYPSQAERNLPTIPMQVSEGEVTRHFLEIPFMSQYKFLIVPQDKVYDATLPQWDLSSPGAIIGATDYIPPMTVTYAKVTTGTEIWQALVQTHPSLHDVGIYGAAGDEFRFGLFLGPPLITIPVSVFPDTYASP